jgi:hypothetical protein
MDAKVYSETLIPIYHTTRRHIARECKHVINRIVKNNCITYKYFFSPSVASVRIRVMASPYRAPLDEWSARRIDTKHPQETNTHAHAGFEPTIPTNKLQQTEALDRATTGTGTYKCDQLKIIEICQNSVYLCLAFICKLLNKTKTGLRL